VTTNMTVAVTSVTEIAVKKAGTLTQANITAANQMLSNLLGGVNILTTIPAIPTDPLSASSTSDAKNYGLMLATISQMATDQTYSSGGIASVMAAVAVDLADGTLNSTGSDMSSALASFVSSTFNQAGITADQTSLGGYISYAMNNQLPSGGALGYLASEYVVLNNGDWRVMDIVTSGGTSTVMRSISYPSNIGSFNDVYKEDIVVSGTINSSNYFRVTSDGYYGIYDVTGEPFKIIGKTFNIGDTYSTTLTGATVTFQVIGFEDVLSFKDCLKIQETYSAGVNSGTYTLWYAKGAGFVSVYEPDATSGHTDQLHEASIGGSRYYNAADYLRMQNGDIRTYDGIDSNGTYTYEKRYATPASYGGYSGLFKSDEYDSGALFQTWYIRKTSDGYYMLGGVTGVTPPVKILGTIFKVGDVYITQFSDSNQGGTMRVSVEAMESVTVPYGTFSGSLKLRTNITGPIYSSSKSQWDWYAPNIGHVKFADNQGTTESLSSATLH
jgi:hypothetical protein